MSVLREEYEESQHPRGEHGRWTAKGGLGTQEHYCYMTREQCEMTGLSRLLCRQSQTPSKINEAVRKPPSAA